MISTVFTVGNLSVVLNSELERITLNENFVIVYNLQIGEDILFDKTTFINGEHGVMLSAESNSPYLISLYESLKEEENFDSFNNKYVSLFKYKDYEGTSIIRIKNSRINIFFFPNGA